MLDYHYDWPSNEDLRFLNERQTKHDKKVEQLVKEIIIQKLKTHGGRLNKRRLYAFVKDQASQIMYPESWYTRDGDPIRVAFLSREFTYDGKDVILV